METNIGKSVWDIVAPIAGAALGTVLLPGVGTSLGLGIGSGGGAAIGAGVGSGLSTGVQTGDPLAGLISGVASGGGSYLGGQLLGPELSGIGGSTNAISGGAVPGFMGQELGGFAGNVIPGTVGDIAGSAIGSNLGQSAANALYTPDAMMSGPPQAQGFKPSRAGESGLPQSLSQFSGLDPMQQASGIANQGVYGSGNGPEENQYFLNLINRQLVDNTGNVSDTSSINPIESSYLSQLGLGGYGSSNDLLERISKYQA